MMKKTLLIALALVITGCAQIEQYERISVETQRVHTATIGHELYRVQKLRDLPNVFGRADVWGGKINEGFSELRFSGLTPDGKIIFRLTDVDIESNESVFTRYGMSTSTINTTTNLNASTYGNTTYGTANTFGTVTHYQKPQASITQLPPNTVEFVFDPKDELLELGNIKVEVLEVQKYAIKYMIHKI